MHLRYESFAILYLTFFLNFDLLFDTEHGGRDLFDQVYFHFHFIRFLSIFVFKIINLKAELLQKQEEYKLKKLSKSDSSNEPSESSTKVVFIIFLFDLKANSLQNDALKEAPSLG
jgi:hypothetical protein